MTTIALVHTTDLVAEEFKRRLEERPELWSDLRLFTLEDDSAGKIADVAGAATLVGAVEENSFDQVDIAFFFGSPSRHAKIREALPPAVTAVVVGGLDVAVQADDQPLDSQPLIAGLNLDQLDRRRMLVSPHPATIGLAHLLSPLVPLGLLSASATALLPASTFGQAALDELLDQARDMLSFKTSSEFDLLPGPLAFNLLDAEAGAIGRDTSAVLGDANAAHDLEAPAISVAAVYGGVFHGLGLSLHMDFSSCAEVPDLAAVEQALDSSQLIELAADPHLVGPKDIAGQDFILVAELREAASGRFTLFAVLDPLTIGGANNTLALVEAMATPTTH